MCWRRGWQSFCGHALAWGHSAIVPTSLFRDCVVGTLSVGALAEAHQFDCEQKHHWRRKHNGWLMEKVVWEQGGNTQHALCTQTAPWLPCHKTHWEECEQAIMHPNQNDELWSDHALCAMNRCVLHLTVIKPTSTPSNHQYTTIFNPFFIPHETHLSLSQSHDCIRHSFWRLHEVGTVSKFTDRHTQKPFAS